MNKLRIEKRAQILHCIVEGNSLRATARLLSTHEYAFSTATTFVSAQIYNDSATVVFLRV
jgi:hypothetical protein